MKQKESQFAYKKPTCNPPNIANIIEIETKGPWKTKSNGELNVLFAMPYDDIINYLSYDKNELAQLPEDIRGLRSYIVSGLKRDSEGGGEFHRVRKELFFGLSGVLDLKCEDLYGNKKSFVLDSHKGLYLPPFILHSYTTVEDGGFLVIANTLFPSNSRTHDTYPLDIFRRLQTKYKHI